MYGNIAKVGRKDKKTRYYYYCKNTVNATGHKCTFRCNIEQSQIDDVLAKLIMAMTREGKFKDAIQDGIGATVDTSDLEKQLSVLNANLHQAETIKTRLEQQIDNLDVTDIHYDKKISDLQRRLDTQYDKIDEVEEAIADLKSQVYELKKNQIDADSIYGFLNAFNELYAECTDAEKKQFMQAFIERIDIFPERREDGNWIRNIKFQFPVPILRDGKEVVRVDGISLDKEQSDEHTVTLEKFQTLETVVGLHRKDMQKSLNLRTLQSFSAPTGLLKITRHFAIVGRRIAVASGQSVAMAGYLLFLFWQIFDIFGIVQSGIGQLETAYKKYHLS